MRIINACLELDQWFPGNAFSMDAWMGYMESVIPGSAGRCREEIGEYDFDRQCLPVIQAALDHPERRQEVISSFEAVTHRLEERILETFHRELDTDVILYLGLCHGAGWVTQFGGKTVILLGMEKILELNWTAERDMAGLIYHELGHVYQDRYGVLERECAAPADGFLWQLFTEGMAMYFEQRLMGDLGFYHQDREGWKAFLDARYGELKEDFAKDLETMDRRTQRYFGDWVSYHGVGDAGYYLGARFVQFILERCDFHRALSLDLPEVRTLFGAFLREKDN